MTAVRALAVLALGAAALTGCGLFRSDEARGRHVADIWCSECHRVAPDQPSGTRPGHTIPPRVVAPSFMEIAARPATSAASLEHFLTDLHLPMPTYRLSEKERHQVIAYILSLKPGG